jgi:GH3 auxin-responsive promoter
VNAVELILRSGLWVLGRLPDDVLRAGARALFSKSWARFEDASARPREVQTAHLLDLVARAKETAFGREHGFGAIRSFDDYRARVPIRGYEGFEPYLLRMVKGENDVLTPDRPMLFARSSGTTGTPKYIPVTPAFMHEFRLPRRVWARQVMQAFPGLVRGKFLSVHSPRIEGKTEGGVPFGSITIAFGASQGTEKGDVRSPFDPAPKSIFLLPDPGDRYYALLRFAAQERIALAAAVNPSTLVLLAKKLDLFALDLAADLEHGTMRALDRLPDPIRRDVRLALRIDKASARRIRVAKDKRGRVIPTDVWPEMQGLLTWTGGTAPFYLAQLASLYPGRKAMDYGFVATEGGFTIPLSPDERGGVVAVLGHVLEFVPERSPADSLLADELVIGERYRVLITGANGLYRYDINDVVECTGYHQKTAMIAFVHKGGNMISVTGEKIGESHVIEAAKRAEEETEIRLAGFCVAPDLRDPPYYVFAIEPERAIDPGEAARFESAFEAALRGVNIEYAAKRDSERLGPPKLRVLPKGAFERDRDRRVKNGAPDSHVKPIHLAKDLRMIDLLERGE